MNDAFNLIDHQPGGYPRWHRGYESTTAGIQPTEDQHLFVFEAQMVLTGGRAGTVIPICRFVDGAKYIVFDGAGDLITKPEDAHCPHCLEVELQHGLNAMQDS